MFSMIFAAALQPACLDQWTGNWALTSQGAPYSIYAVDADGVSVRSRADVLGNLQTNRSRGDEQQLAGSVESCDADRLIVSIEGRNNRYQIERLESGDVGLSILDLPESFESPTYSLLPVAAGTRLASYMAERRRDRADDREAVADNQEMTSMFEADQEVRSRISQAMKVQEDGTVSFQGDIAKEMSEGDAARHARTLELLAEGALNTANDYYHAAFIFQHGGEPADYLRAHHLGIVAVSLGKEDAQWIAAAALDRYLLSIEQKQIYGTQYRGSPTGEDVRSPIQEGVISNAERAKLGIAPVD